MPAAYRRDLYDFINRPIPRLLRYDLLLKEIHKMSSREGLDTDEVQQVLDELQRSAAIVDKAVEDAQWKVELWHLKDVLTVSSESKLSSSVVRLPIATTRSCVLLTFSVANADLRSRDDGPSAAAYP
jgi:hypothetical protein